MSNWSPCPRCESKRVQKVSKWGVSLFFLGAASLFIWLGFLFPIVWFLIPVFLILAIVILFGKSTWQCQDCKHSWTIKKDTKKHSL